VSYFGNHEAFHAGRLGDRAFPVSRWPRALRMWRWERGCGLLWGRHCFHRRKGLVRMLTWWECCMCTRVVHMQPADQCVICEQLPEVHAP